MTAVVLSYAEEDSEVAKRLAEGMQAGGTDVFWWQDPQERGSQFIPNLERKIRSADRFVALLSPDYLGSVWCRRELDLALLCENDPAKQLIKVVRVRATPMVTGSPAASIARW